MGILKYFVIVPLAIYWRMKLCLVYGRPRIYRAVVLAALVCIVAAVGGFYLALMLAMVGR